MAINGYLNIECPDCKQTTRIKVWDVLSKEDHPRIAQRLINGTFFEQKCKHCGTVHSITYPVLYEDAFSNSMICFETNALGESKALSAIKNRRNDMCNVADDCKIRIVNSTNALREKARIFECGLDDRLIEIMKIAILEHNGNGNKIGNIEETLCWVDEKQQLFFFEFFGKKNYSVTGTMEFYNYIKDKCLDMITKQDPNPVYVDNEWAMEFLERNHFTTE